MVAYSDALIDELKQADVIVLGLPMYNFGVPSQLKAYFDHIARAGVTFSYTAEGPVGLLTGKKVYVFAARGGLYAGTPLDTQTSYVRDFLRFLGIVGRGIRLRRGPGDRCRRARRRRSTRRTRQIDGLLEMRAAA